MLQVIEQLKSGQVTLESLKDDLGIKHVEHPELPLVILNYDQIESPKTHPLVRECRSLTLEKGSWDLVARSFQRFFNWGEVIDEQDDFNFSDFRVESKEDGSLVTVYHYDGKWHANTRGSFGLQEVQFTDHTWRDLVVMSLGINDLQELGRGLREGHSYVFELATPFNKVVRTYPNPRMYLLTAFYPDGREYDYNNSNDIDYLIHACDKLAAFRPDVFSFGSIDEIKDYLDKQVKNDPTWEGVVIRDDANRRWKIKNPGYLSLHKMRGENDNLFNPKHLLPFALKGERSELLTYFPEVEEKFDEVAEAVEAERQNLLQVWFNHYQIEDQKDFALAIQGKTRFTSLLFKNRAEGGGVEELDKSFRQSEKLIHKVLFK